MPTHPDNQSNPSSEGLDAIQKNLERLRAALGSSSPPSESSRRASTEVSSQESDDEQGVQDSGVDAADGVDADSAKPVEDLQGLEKAKAELQHEAIAMRQQADALQAQRRHAADIIEQRNHVMEMQRLLGDAEQRMIRRWGIQQAFGWTIRALVCLTFLMGLSLFAGRQLSHQVWVATASVQQYGTDIEDQDAWIADQEQLIRNPATVTSAVNHLRRSGYTGSTNRMEFHAQLDAGLAVSSPGSGVIHLELRGEDKDSLEPLLNALAQAYTTAVTKQQAGPAASRTYINQKASLSDFPVYDNRSSLTAILFSCSVVVTILVIALFAWLIVRTAKGEVQMIHNEQVMDDNSWKAYHDALEKDEKAQSPLF